MFEYVKIDDTKVLITNTRDIVDELSINHYEIANCLINEINLAYNEKELQEKRIHTDLECYEADLEANRNAFSDILEELKTNERLMDSKRTNKVKVDKSLSQIHKIISNVY